MESISRWLTDLKKIIFIQGDSTQIKGIMREINKTESTFRQEYETIIGRIQNIKTFLKLQSSQSSEGLLKIKLIDKLLYDRPCCIITLYRESDIDQLQEDQFYLKEVTRHVHIRLIILIQTNQYDYDKEQDFKRMIEIETKSIMFYQDNINSKRLMKLIEDNIKTYYTDLSKRKKKKIKQSSEPICIENNLRITIQMIFYYEIQNKIQKSNKYLTNSRNNILQLMYLINQQIQDQMIDQNSLFQNLHLILRLQELRSILDLFFFKRLKQQDS